MNLKRVIIEGTSLLHGIIFGGASNLIAFDYLLIEAEHKVTTWQVFIIIMKRVLRVEMFDSQKLFIKQCEN